VEAIKSGVQPGLTMVVGPPGTGKTDTAVQILTVLYHNCPSQRTLLITHSNQALNDLFEKFMQRDVPARYLLRLGMGEKELESEQNFSRQVRGAGFRRCRVGGVSCESGDLEFLQRFLES
jgi:intron-binding protein aquarius